MSEVPTGIETDFTIRVAEPIVSTEAIGMRKIEENPPEKTEPILESISQADINTKETYEPTVKDLFKSSYYGGIDTKSVDSLLQKEDNPEAQLAALISISGNYSNTSNRYIDLLSQVNLDMVSSAVGLKPEQTEIIKTKTKILIDKHKVFYEIKKQVLELNSYVPIGMEEHDYFKEEVGRRKELRVQERILSKEIKKLDQETFLPIRSAILLATKEIPEEYKLKTIKGFEGADQLLPTENSLLKLTYYGASEKIKRQIANTASDRVGRDINSLNLVPLNELKSLVKDEDRLFLLILHNPQTTGELVETKIAPVFFPDEDSKKVKQCYEVLKKVTRLREDNEKTTFYSDGYNTETDLINIRYFKNFIKNSDELIPIVDVLSEYGFNYVPVTPLERKFYPEYITRLKELGENLDKLKEELSVVKSIIPDYKYSLKVDIRIPEITGSQEIYIEDNPFSIALEQKISPHYHLDEDNNLEKATQLFESLHKIVPERWRSGFIATYIDLMSKTAGNKDYSKDITRLAIAEAGKYAFEESLTSKDVELFASEFLRVSLDPQNESIRTAFEFCDRYADKITTYLNEGRKNDSDSTWYMFSLLSADLYRYPLFIGKEEEAIDKTKGDLKYAVEAVSKIKNPSIRDKAISNIILGLTDEEVGDLTTARSLVEVIVDENLKKDSQSEIQLEIERISKGESTTWKKMEKARRISEASTKFLAGLFGYSSTEDYNEAQKLYSEVNKSWMGGYEYSDERKVQLEQETERTKESFGVTLNVTWANVLGILENGRVISIWENPKAMELRNSDMPYHYGTRRDQVERAVGNRAKGGMKDPHPVYAAASSSNNRDEFYGGTGGGYGETFLVLKNDRIKDRTTFCYDDSFDGYSKWLLDWKGGITAKAIHNLNGKTSSRHGYVEAQVLGGITSDDIESINIPSDAINQKNEYGWSTGTDIQSKIEELRQAHPEIKINIIDVPKK